MAAMSTNADRPPRQSSLNPLRAAPAAVSSGPTGAMMMAGLGAPAGGRRFAMLGVARWRCGSSSIIVVRRQGFEHSFDRYLIGFPLAASVIFGVVCGACVSILVTWAGASAWLRTCRSGRLPARRAHGSLVLYETHSSRRSAVAP